MDIQKNPDYLKDYLKKRKRRKHIQKLIMSNIYIIVPVFLLASCVCIFAVRHAVKSHAAKSAASGKAAGDSQSAEKKPESPVTVRTAGDIVVHSPFLESPLYFNSTEESFDFHNIFTHMKKEYEEADFTAVTLESTLVETAYESSGFPLFRTPDAMADALADSGVDLCLLGNNHIYDNFDDGFFRTMEVIEDRGMHYGGIRKSLEDDRYLIQNINGIHVGFINYVYETISVDGQKMINAIPMSAETAPLINSFQYEDLDSFYAEMEENLDAMRKDGAEYIIVYMHWGNEYQVTESEEQREIAQKLCDLGVDSLIGSHPHVIQPVDVFTSSDGGHQMFCAFAIGNHLSNQKKERMEDMPTGETEDGLMVTLELSYTKDDGVILTDVDFLPTWVHRPDRAEAEFFILPLQNPDTIEADTGLSKIEDLAQESVKRTEAITGEGIQRVKDALPLK